MRVGQGIHVRDTRQPEIIRVGVAGGIRERHVTDIGTEQHGLSDLQFLAMILKDPLLVESARDEALRWIAAARSVEGARELLRALGQRWNKRLELSRIG